MNTINPLSKKPGAVHRPQPNELGQIRACLIHPLHDSSADLPWPQIEPDRLNANLAVSSRDQLTWLCVSPPAFAPVNPPAPHEDARNVRCVKKALLQRAGARGYSRVVRRLDVDNYVDNDKRAALPRPVSA